MPKKNIPPVVNSQLVNAQRLAAKGKIDEALSLCRKAYELAPASDNALRLAMPLLLKQKKTAAALDWLKKCVTEHPSSWRAAAMLDLMRMEGAKVNELKAEARKYLKTYPQDVDVLLSAGAALQACREPAEAAEAYTARLAIRPNDAGTLNNLGHCKLDRGDMEGALEAWRRILNLPNVEKHVALTARYNLARALMLRGDRVAAETEARKLCDLAPENPAYRRLVADMNAGRGERSTAIQEAETALEQDRGDVQSWLRLIRLVGQSGDLEKAFEMLKEASRVSRKPLEARKALAQAKLGRGDEHGAIADLEWWHRSNPDEAEYALMLGRLHEGRARFDEALDWFKKAEKINWRTGGAAILRFHEARSEPDKSLEKARQLLEKEPDSALYHGYVAETLYSLGRYEEAQDVVNAGLDIAPTDLALSGQKLRMLLLAERYDDAETFAREMIRRDPQTKNWLRLVGVLRQAGKNKEAIEVARQQHDEQPKDILWFDEYASALAFDHQLELAGEILEQAHKAEPANLKISGRLLAVYRELEKYEDAHSLSLEMRRANGESPGELRALTRVLTDLGRLEEALDYTLDGVKRYPDDMGLWFLACDFLRRLDRPEKERELTLEIMRRFPAEKTVRVCGLNLVRLRERIDGKVPAIDNPDIQTIISCIRQWATRTPNHPDIWWFQADIGEKLNRKQDALAAMDALERRFPNDSKVFARRAGILSGMNQASKALEYRRKALSLRPESVPYTQALLDELVKYGDFSEFDSLMARLKHLLGNRRYSYYRNLFFNLNCHPTYTPAQVYEYFHDWYEKSVKPGLPPVRKHAHVDATGRRLRLGYVSPDFRRHSMAYFMEPIFRGQQVQEFRDNFEVFCYAHFDPGQKDSYTDFFRQHSDHWIEISSMGEDELESRIRQDQIDILIDMAGHTANNKLGVFLRRPAPVQAGWIYGYVQTTGLPQLDWMVCDSQEVPPEHEPYMAEGKMARFSFGGHPYAPPPDAEEPVPLPCLYRGYVTFGVTTQARRFNEDCARIWSEVLKKAPTAKIRFQREVYLEPEIQKLVLQRFEKYGIGQDRIEFMCVKPLWKAYSDFDCHLDTFPVGYVTTLYEGLWMERPCVSMKARPPMGRVGYGTMETLGLSKYCCAENENEYIEKAAALGNDVHLMQATASNLRQRMRASKIMDYENFGRELAGLYREMWDSRA